MVASRLVRIEAERALIRFGLAGPALERAIPRIRRSLEALWTRIDCLEITPEVCDLAGRIGPASRLRTLDAIHLATFRLVQKLDPGLEMLSLDQRLLSEL